MNVMEVVRIVSSIPLPISIITVEDVTVDIRRLSDSNVRGSEYQQSNRLDENLRLACLMRDNFTCQKCRKVDKRDRNFVLPDGYTLYKKGDVIDIDGLQTEIASINGKGKGFYYWRYQSDGSRKYASVSHKKVRLIEYAKTINYMSGDVAFRGGMAYS